MSHSLPSPAEPPEIRLPLPVLDVDRALACYVHDRAEALRLLASGGYQPVGGHNKIRALRAKRRNVVACAKVQRNIVQIRKPGLGAAHRHESYWNPRGVWTIDRIPDFLAPMFGVAERQRAA